MTDQKQFKKYLLVAGILFLCFLFVLLAVKSIDVKPIGPQDSSIGLAAINGAVRDFFGVNMIWYDITDILGYFTFAVAAGFAFLGLYQLIRRKSLKKVDADILLLGAFYAVVLGIYVFFEICIVNYRPIILQEELEASFPSSHTMLVCCIMGSAMYQFKKRLAQKALCMTSIVISAVIMAVMVSGRLISGVHWFSDILGGVLISGALIFTYIAFCEKLKNQ